MFTYAKLRSYNAKLGRWAAPKTDLPENGENRTILTILIFYIILIMSHLSVLSNKASYDRQQCQINFSVAANSAT